MEVLRNGVRKETDVAKRGGSAERVAFQPCERAEKPDAGKQHPFSEERLVHAVEHANKLSVMFNRNLKFEYRREADIYQVSVIDSEKDEVVRKIPSDEIVRFIESIKDMFGAMFDVLA